MELCCRVEFIDSSYEPLRVSNGGRESRLQDRSGVQHRIMTQGDRKRKNSGATEQNDVGEQGLEDHSLEPSSTPRLIVHKLAIEKLFAVTDDWSVHVLVVEDVMHVSVNSGNVLASVQPSGGGMCHSPCTSAASASPGE